ncbi:MAG: AAA family ATPase [Candidatus Caldatribacteriaceae bacterium]
MICLKTITLQGFKSFAHLTVVDFSPGLNVIVGPNGSGKSNLLDALRFVLGERAREGRGGQASRVIFHGSSSLKSLGMASVETRWIGKDNGHSWSVERRVFASGESEYFWNGEKVRLLDVKLGIQETGFSLERLSMGVVSNDYLVALFDLRPSERLRWLEQMSGVAEIRTKLNALFVRLERIRERERRFAERLKEIESQMERLQVFAREEEEYLRTEREVRAVRKFYLCKLKALREDRIHVLSRERAELERKVAALATQIDVRKEELSRGREHLDRLRFSLQKLQEEKERGESLRRKSEEELYHLLTRHRESLKFTLFYREKLKVLEQDIIQLESRAQEWLQKGQQRTRGFNGDKAQAVLLRFRKEKVQELSLLEERRVTLEKRLAREEASLARFVEERQREEKRKEKIGREIESLCRGATQKDEDLRSLQERRRALEDELRRIQETLHKRKILLQKMAKKAIQVKEGHLSPETQEVLDQLSRKGWPQRSLYALSWFFQDKEWYEKTAIDLKELVEKSLGKLVVPRSPSSWSFCSLQEIQSLLRANNPLSSNLVSSDGSCIVLQGGILAFPFKVISSSRGLNFLRSLRQRKARLEKGIQSAEQRVEALGKELRLVEKKCWEIEFELEHIRERIAQLQREYQDIALEIEEKRKGEEEMRGEIDGISSALFGLQQEKERLENLLKKLEQGLKKVQEILLERKKAEGERERLRWEVQVFQEKLEEIQSLFEEERKKRSFYHENLQALLPSFQEHQALLAEKTMLLEKNQHAEKIQGLALEKKESEIRELERKRGELWQKLERIHLQEEKLSLEKEMLERELEELNDVEAVKGFESWEMKDIEDFLEKRRAWLKSQKVRRGAIEELRDLQRHYDTLKEKDDEIRHCLHRAGEECFALEREGKKRFKEFLRETRHFFERYFDRVFQGGEVYFLEEPGGVDIEVKVPGKKRQSLSFLSSGERALTALCLLFATFEAGRFPFCFLDEVDANLDHTNSALFAGVLSDFSRSRQVIVVTHQEEVMERAQRIIGVTMNEPGVSQVVCFEPPVLRESREEKHYDFFMS